jgi:hypothetical protein
MRREGQVRKEEGHSGLYQDLRGKERGLLWERRGDPCTRQMGHGKSPEESWAGLGAGFTISAIADSKAKTKWLIFVRESSGELYTIILVTP